MNTVINVLKKCGRFVIFNFGGLFTAASGNLTLTIPEEFRPKKEVLIPYSYYPAYLTNPTSTSDGSIKLGINGILKFGTNAAYILNAGWDILEED